MIDTIRLTHTEKDKLITLKRRTGIENWNVLCRWALCHSLSQPEPPPDMELSDFSGTEMTWSTFGGKEIELYKALLRSRLIVKNHSVNDQSVHKTLRKHLYRGIMAMADRGKASGIAEFFSIARNS